MMCKNMLSNEKVERASDDKHKTSQCKGPKQKFEKPNNLPKESTQKSDARSPSICIVSNSYKIVKQAASKIGLREVSQKSPWNLFWTDSTLTVQQCRELKRYQMVNYFPGIGEIARKDLLARNLARMQRHFPDDYNFFPKTWWLPADLGDLLLHARSKRGDTYIVKPGCGSQGRGILITKNVSDLELVQQSICQLYIPRPLLIDGFKFDIRIYTVITSCDPLRIFVFNEGIVRFATHKYSEPLSDNVNNVFMHLTNYAINKNHCAFVKGEDGSKRRISVLNSWMSEQGIDVPRLWGDIDCAIVKTVITCAGVLKHNYHLCFPRHPQACFILLGIDVLLDTNLKPFIIEVNRCPSLNIDSVLDVEVKEQLLVDTFNLLNLGRLDQQRVQGEERRRVFQRTQHAINRLSRRMEQHSLEGETDTVTDLTQAQIAWEEKHMGNFRKVYPVSDSDKYDNFFIEAYNSLYQETAASRARKEHALQQKNDQVSEEESFAEVNFTGCDESESGSSEDESSRSKITAQRKIIRGRIPVMNSFEPQYVSTAEERERLRALDKRDELVRSLNLRAYLFDALKVNGDLREEDEVREKARSPRIAPSVSPGSLQIRATAAPNWPRKDLLPPLDRLTVPSFHSNELRVVCSEAPLALRPLPSRVARWASLNQQLNCQPGSPKPQK